MRLKYNFVTNKVADKIVAVATGSDLDKFNGYIKLNGSGAFIFEQLKKDITESELVAEFLKTYDATEEQARETVKEFIDALDKSGILLK